MVHLCLEARSRGCGGLHPLLLVVNIGSTGSGNFNQCVNNSDSILAVPGMERRVLLHTCCAPCSSAIIEALVKGGVKPVIYYSNPNIFPEEEYLIRKKECSRYAASLGLEIVDADYDHEEWLRSVRGLEGEPERGARCLACFKLRLLRTACYAHEHGFKVITTTLASSRWKSLDQINEAGSWAVAQFDDVLWWDRNWRKGGLQERRSELIRQHNFYNQLYCGCEFSMRQKEPGRQEDPGRQSEPKRQ